MSKFFSSFISILKNYCENSTLAGLVYIADSRYHFSERLFWIICVILSWIGSTYLILQYMESYYTNSVSMGVVTMRPTDAIKFPSLGVCEMGYTKEEYHELEKVIYEIMDPQMSQEEKEGHYNYDVEDFLLRVIFHNLYNYGSMSSYCTPYIDCEDDCLKCPMKGYQQFADRVRANCGKLFHDCRWNEKPFNCCEHFQPVRTTLGTCFILNSIQVANYSKYWLDMRAGMREGNGHLELTVTKSSALYILNEEDIPHMLLTTLQFPQIPDGYDGEILLAVQDTLNDPYLLNIDPNLRKCIFPDEPTDTAYRKYSYSTCVTECLKKAQMRNCNCTHYNLIVDENDSSPECDFFGLTCLDKNNLLFPQTTIMQPWQSDGMVCTCLPSCNEPQINVVGRSSKIRDDTGNLRTSSIRIQQLPTQRYYRQAVREKVDIVVSVGGILGLFMGASILSLFEFFYFFMIRSWRK